MDQNSETKHGMDAAVAQIFSIKRSAGSTHRELADSIRSRIVGGGLEYGVRLPTIRALASALQLNRNLVARAFLELRSDGLIAGRARGGTWVCYSGPLTQRKQLQAHRNARWIPKNQRFQQTRAESVRWDLRPGQASMRSLPVEVWRRACKEAGRHLPPAGYGDPAGELELRKGLATYLSRTRAYTVGAENILVTGGSGAAMALLARTLSSDDTVLATEDPGYRRVIGEFERLGARILSIPIDFDVGLDLCGLPDGKDAPTIVHVTPAHQYPLGLQLSSQKRTELIRWARKNGALIIENDYDHEFFYGREQLQPLATMAPDCVALIGTFSKALSPSIRIGYIAGPSQLIATLRAFVEISREQVSWPLQQTLLWLLRSGTVDAHVAKNRRHYQSLRDVIRSSLFPLRHTFPTCGDSGGLHVIVRVPSWLDVRTVQTTLRQAGILMERVGESATWGRDLNALILGYGHLELTEIESGMRELTKLLSKIATGTSRTREIRSKPARRP